MPSFIQKYVKYVKQKCLEVAAKEDYDLAIQYGNVNSDGRKLTIVTDACCVNSCCVNSLIEKNYTALPDTVVMIGYRTHTDSGT